MDSDGQVEKYSGRRGGLRERRGDDGGAWLLRSDYVGCGIDLSDGGITRQEVQSLPVEVVHSGTRSDAFAGFQAARARILRRRGGRDRTVARRAHIARHCLPVAAPRQD